MSLQWTIDLDPGTDFRFGVRPLLEDNNGVRQPYDLTNTVITLTVAGRGSIPTILAPDGTIECHFTAADTLAFRRDTWYWIDAVLPSGDNKRLLEGPIHVRPLGGVPRGA